MLASIYFDGSSGSLYISGDSGNNVGQSSLINSSTLRASVDGISKDYNSNGVSYIYFIGQSGNNRFTNTTSIDSWQYGNGGNNVLIGGSGNDILIGGGGDDELRGGNGADLLFGISGNNTLYGGAGDDLLATGGGTSFAYGEAGNDLMYGGSGVDTMDGGDGIDQIYAGAGNDILSTGNGGVPGNPDLIMGWDGNDHFTGGNGYHVFYGGNGNDVMVGGSGESVMFGESGNDSMTGGSAKDYLDAGAGDDTINGGGDKDYIIPGTGDDTINGNADHDFVKFSSQSSNYQILGLGGSLTVVDTRGIDGTDTVSSVEGFRFTDKDQAAVSSITKVVKVQPIIVSNSNGSNTAEFLGNSTEEAKIKNLIDAIYYQAGIDIEWLTERTWDNTFANIGSGGSRPGSDLGTVISQGDTAGKGHTNSLIIDMYFVEIAAGFGNTSENTANGLAYVDANGITVHVGDNLVSFDSGREVIARVVAHEIAHNLGLDHVSDSVNLMADGDHLTAAQIANIRDSNFAAWI